MKEAAGSERPLLCDGGRGPATERHACRPAPNNIANYSPDSLMRIKLRRDALRKARSARGRQRSRTFLSGPAAFLLDQPSENFHSIRAFALDGASFSKDGRAESHSVVQRIPRSDSSASLISRSASALSFVARASLRYRTARRLLMATQILTQRPSERPQHCSEEWPGNSLSVERTRRLSEPIALLICPTSSPDGRWMLVPLRT
jgi:hypothetical protein